MATITQTHGGVTTAKGFAASGVAAGIKKSGNEDLAVVRSEKPCTAAGAFTQNAVRAACVDRNRALLPSNDIYAIVVNAGNANACTGTQGKQDVETTALRTAEALSIRPKQVLVASTGVIGEFLPMDRVTQGIKSCAPQLSVEGGTRFAEAIMTTDTVVKEYALSVGFTKGTILIGGCAKGSGMIHPNMATMLAFITTDAAIAPQALDKAIKRVVDKTFNNLTIDGDTSTNDMVVILANGMSGVPVTSASELAAFENALYEICNNQCSQIAADGEGATKRVDITVTGGETSEDNRRAAKSIAGSNLVKTAMFGGDPNWGRILCAVGYSGARFSEENIEVRLCGLSVCRALRPVAFPADEMHSKLSQNIVSIEVDLGLGGNDVSVAHTCDLTYDYVKINAEYHT
ncbi:MAG: bifunctional glutamate N-acetyltransferase/amino-acid acetyltransferase ArgJ [Chitinivibrionales bacterium]|nr:bifunctional glutamate N-acetyltransferase/amino-acid acetyltransferase ArgJ [Chitinivibrionales bacterium]MBD3356262.1 bifunctional glutamate N-acetyltransferase/amino-acid acetyltransferase ArgJ [Chitinivibrionales bacterium]